MKNYYFVSGLGQGKSKSRAATKALEASSLTQCRPLLHTYLISNEAIFLDSAKLVEKEGVVDAIVATAEGVKGSFISAGVVIGDLYRKGKKEKTVVCKEGGEYAETELHKILRDELESLCEEGEEIQNERFLWNGLKVEEAYGSVFVGLGLTKEGASIENTPFLGKQTAYDKAKYVAVPVLHEYPQKKSCIKAPLAVFRASRGMEDYDIETDQQLSTKGVHTLEPIISQELPNQFVERIALATTGLLRDKKFPIFLGVDQTLTIGAMQGIRDVVGAFSVLHLGASTQLRSSFDGSQYSQACAMKKGMEYAKEVIQVGIRATSNREKKELQYDKIFFASDIFSEADDHWMEDVCEELGPHPVYITIDANVFDSSVMRSRKPEPMGLSYQKVLKLLKLVARRKTVVGLDFVGLQTEEGEIFSELAAARLIYQFLCYLTKN